MPAKFDWLDSKHPVYKDNYLFWLTEERRLRGGVDVLRELVPFEWEDTTWDSDKFQHVGAPGGHYELRKTQATYPAFSDLFATSVMGHLMEKSPEPGAALDFGTLGDPRRASGTPSQASLVYYNVDGVGVDGSQWNNWWYNVAKRAQATGHRWIFVEAPSQAPGFRNREIQGLRPYLKEFSPTQVTDWHYVHGQLAYAIVRFSRRAPKVAANSGHMETGKSGLWYLLLVRKGFNDLDSDGLNFGTEGGWFLFDPEKEPVDFGDWRMTDGDIPLFPYFYEREEGDAYRASMSRMGLQGLGQIGISYMNLSSAADFDAWDAAKSEKYVLGVDKSAWELVMTLKKEGSTMIPVLTNEENGNAPTIYDGSSGAVAADVFELSLERKRSEAREISAREVTSTPDSSGISKIAGFGENKSPRLALIASELEQAQNTAIYFLEKRWGNRRPTGSVEWPRKFDLTPLLDDIRSMFELERLAQATSKTLKARSLVLAAREKGLIADDKDAQLIQKEYEDDLSASEAQREAERNALAELGG